MHCHTHRAETATGICKSCGRGVCALCVRESALAIACSQVCEENAAALQTMNERAMQIYGIGTDRPKGLPTNAVMPAVMGLGFLGWGDYDYFVLRTDMWIFMSLMGLLFLFGSWLGWRKFRQNGLNV